MKFNIINAQILLVVAVLTVSTLKIYTLEKRVQELELNIPVKVYKIPFRLDNN